MTNECNPAWYCRTPCAFYDTAHAYRPWLGISFVASRPVGVDLDGQDHRCFQGGLGRRDKVG